MGWRALLPFLRPLVPIAVDYARARMENNAVNSKIVADERSLDSAEARMAQVESRMQALVEICQQQDHQLEQMAAEFGSRVKTARAWIVGLLVWNLALTALLLFALLRR